MKIIPGLLFTILLTLSLTASATDIRIRVLDRDDAAPLENAAVCLGTSARIDQFGAHITDGEGAVSFSGVPRAPLVITISRQGYKAEQETLVTSSTRRMLVMSLSPGGGGTPCPLSNSAARVYGGGLGISRFVLDNGKSATAGHTVTLNNRINGQPTHYRASERKDFMDSRWQSYSTAPTFQLSPNPGRKVVYFQVRRHVAVGAANIETRSPIVQASITVQ